MSQYKQHVVRQDAQEAWEAKDDELCWYLWGWLAGSGVEPNLIPASERDKSRWEAWNLGLEDGEGDRESGALDILSEL